MKKYVEVELNIVMLETQDVITASGGFAGGFEDGLGDPNVNAVTDPITDEVFGN